MSFTDSVSLHGRQVSLAPLTQSHHDDLVEAVKDGELWTGVYSVLDREWPAVKANLSHRLQNS